jgi:two-component system, NtrC family, sensor histidine kinase HydH
MPDPKPDPARTHANVADARGALRTISQVLPEPPRPETLLVAVLEEACRMLEADAGRIRILADGQVLTTAAFRGPDGFEQRVAEGEDEQDLQEVAIKRGLIWHRPMVIDPRQPASRVAMPLLVQTQVIGVLELWRQEGPDFATESDDLLGMLSKFACAMVCGTALYSDLEARHRQLQALHDVQFLITSHRELQEVLDAIVQNTRRMFQARECTIRLVERGPQGGLQLRVVAWSGRPVSARVVWPLERGSIDDEVMAGRIVYIEDLRTDARVQDAESIVQRGLVSLLAAPLRHGDQIIGGLRVYTGMVHQFSGDEAALLESLAGQAAVAIENARLYSQLAHAHDRILESYEELRETQAELVKKEKLAALGEMAALVAHEIRNPLTAVRGFAQRVQRKLAEQPPLAQSLQIVIDEVDRLNRVLNDVLDFARRLEPRFGEHSLNRLVADVVGLEAAVLTERQIQIITDCAPDLPPVRMDPNQMRQVLLNLVANARQAMGTGGSMTLRTRHEADGWQALDVTDTGPGIPPDVQAKLFTPFFTTKLRGTGLGLSAAQRIVEDHGGRITYETTEGRGTTFTLHLPPKPPEPEAAPALDI